MISYLCWALIIYAQFCIAAEATEPVEETTNEPKIICRYQMHTWYDDDFRDYFPGVINETYCTHIVYRNRVSYSPNQYLHDGKKSFYNRIPEFRKKGINVSVNLFKFNGYDFALKLKDNPTERASFVLWLVGYMEQNNFNGFDLQWNCKSCSIDNDEIFFNFVHQIYEAFKPRGWLLSTFVFYFTPEEHPGFDFKKFSEYFDWISVFPVFDSSHSNTQLLMPLFSYPDSKSSLNGSVNYFIEEGVPSHKLVLPVSTSGGYYTLGNASQNGLNAPINNRYGGGEFFSICKQVKDGNWSVVHDKRGGSYAYLDDKWNSYNDVADVQLIGEYIIQNNLGGGILYQLNNDDFEGNCGCGKSPLLKALSHVLRKVSDPKLTNCT